MAFRTWVKLLGAALGIAALAGASQLGIAYGLGILRLTRVLDVATRDQWTAQLAWVAWLAMTSAVLGALAGGRVRQHLRGPATAGTHIALAVAAGAGAAVVVPLTMQPARTAQIAGVHPVFVIGVCAAFGALVGAFAAYAALAHVVARWSMTAVGIAIWVIALVAVAPSLTPGPLPAVRLGVFDAGFSPAVTQRTALFTMPALALLIGAAHGWAARRREMPTLTIALAGLPGPALLTVAYLIAGPGSGPDRYQVVPYWAAMTATGAGVLGSVLAAVIGRGDAEPEEEEDGDRAGARVPEQRAGSAPADGASAATLPGGNPATTPPGADPAGPPGANRGTTPPGASPVTTAAGATAVASGDSAATLPSGRRSSAVDAFTARSGEWPVRRTEAAGGRGGVALGDYAGREPEPFDAFATGSRTAGSAATGPMPVADSDPSGRNAPASAAHRSGYSPDDSHRPGHSPAEPHRPGSPSPEPRRPGWARSGGGQHSAADPGPYVPEPATRPLPPEAAQTPAAQAPSTRNSGLLSRMPFGRGRNRGAKESHAEPKPAEQEPFTGSTAPGADAPAFGATRGAPAFRATPDAPARSAPEAPAFRSAPNTPAFRSAPDTPAFGSAPDTPVLREAPTFRDAPPPPAPGRTSGAAPAPAEPSTWPGRQPLIPEPHAVSAPLPHPEPITPPLAVQPAPPTQDDRRSRKRGRNDDEFVDWVSGLGSDDGR